MHAKTCTAVLFSGFAIVFEKELKLGTEILFQEIFLRKKGIGPLKIVRAAFEILAEGRGEKTLSAAEEMYRSAADSSWQPLLSDGVPDRQTRQRSCEQPDPPAEDNSNSYSPGRNISASPYASAGREKPVNQRL